MSNKIVIAGGTGFLGSAIIKAFPDYEIVLLTRTIRKNEQNIRYILWDAKNIGNWTKELEGSKAIINLVGRSVNCRYTDANKQEIIDSRVDATLIIGKAIGELNKPPEVWVNAGSAAIFGNSGDEVKVEDSPTGSGFSPEVCKAWEKAFDRYDTPKTRKVFLRIGMVLQQNGGILKPFLNMAKFGLGGKIGTGNQYMTWIHEQDFTDLIRYTILDADFKGIVHAASPFPVTNKEFMKTIRQSVNIPFGLPNPAIFIKIGAVFIGTEAELVLSGRRVVSSVLEKNGFKFKYPYLHDAVTRLLNENKLSLSKK
ncbi:TIGR01777 family protein [Pedobacter panaciterrae]|uniref:TIGR01777 family oxidoreductase n=1 Tax=Pedobacter panaciterrae TaxID=363849 RepID=UPI00155DCDFF|nr:TIGR01777 family oxidoreductase [Pedobacter panaciterrae]NQX57131.1 TIGR01777 family protein [Pedobacter panaciterrae]